MIDNADAEVHVIHNRWHEAIVARDLDALVAPCADSATLEIPLILVTLPERTRGTLRGTGEIRPFFEAGLRKFGSELNCRHRTGLFFSNGQRR